MDSDAGHRVKSSQRLSEQDIRDLLRNLASSPTSSTSRTRPAGTPYVIAVAPRSMDHPRRRAPAAARRSGSGSSSAGLGGSLGRLHAQLADAAAYYRAQLGRVEADMGRVRAYADADAADRLWRRALAVRTARGDSAADFDAAAALVAARLQAVRDAHAALTARGDVWARVRADSLVAILDVRGAEIARLVRVARDQCVACQQLVDELDLAAAATDPSSARIRAIVASTSSGGRSRRDRSDGTDGSSDEDVPA